MLWFLFSLPDFSCKALVQRQTLGLGFKRAWDFWELAPGASKTILTIFSNPPGVTPGELEVLCLEFG